MPVPHISDNFADVLDPRFEAIIDEELQQLPDFIPMLFQMPPTNGRDTMRWSDVGTLPNWTEFNGAVTYQSQAQGFDTTGLVRSMRLGSSTSRSALTLSSTTTRKRWRSAATATLPTARRARPPDSTIWRRRR